ncbi:MAG: ribosome-binding factor A [Candidatus Niyogibacteria bacterium CG10_big_fil_rev_8_21_14_0_10_46_36]|uniref:Ribosome-binding factor A n=1 Tax=Candidatus Niyogibacteria bacterium CG10_big_fil_rev_8_21_14_0_10_46_36 TaxID=1974726 RepID=A0A2H0TDB9_9BACT|nr:MAG: ribosome-binding factor A [Candidatus Niyogibacteria bacterium CG10_big_fil_rev_8_21_14_0_10_46_36]
MSFRKEKLASLLSRIIPEFIFSHLRYEDARVTVTRIDLSSNFQKAVIFVTIDPKDKSEEALNELKKILSSLRKEVGKNLSMKFLPMFEFEIDAEEEHRMHIEALIEKIKKEK